MRYEVEIFQDFKGLGGRRIHYVLDTLEKVKECILNRKKNEEVLSVQEFHLVYKHPITLPMCDEMSVHSRFEIYHDWIKIPKDQIQTVKQKSYKHNFIDSDDFSHYCLNYDALSEHQGMGWIYKVSANYDLNNSDRQAIMKALYQHSKSNRVFNLRLYQYRYLPVEDILLQ